ncbi:hypothetical protein ACNQ6O_02355 [Marinobacter sp. SBS5]|uniref:hypothetical protein n=1 Tax=Marinobacter sp. SBS5 TaxID=3401754 RepID=UPI003AAD5E41
MKYYLPIFFFLALSACGGGGDSDSKSETNRIICEPAKTKFASPTAQGAGIYRGFLENGFDDGVLGESSESSTTAEGIGLLSPSGRIAFVAGNGVVTGFFTLLSPSALDGTSTLDGNIKLWNSPTESDNLDLDGYLTAERDVMGYCMTCNYSSLGGPFYQFDAQYQVPKADICLASVDATGSWSQVDNGETTTLTIDGDNDFTGSDSSGCVYSGSLRDGNIEGGIMEINTTISNCDKAGQYIGVGSILGPSKEEVKNIIGAIWSDSRVIPIALDK